MLTSFYCLNPFLCWFWSAHSHLVHRSVWDVCSSLHQSCAVQLIHVWFYTQNFNICLSSLPSEFILYPRSAEDLFSGSSVWKDGITVAVLFCPHCCTALQLGPTLEVKSWKGKREQLWQWKMYSCGSLDTPPRSSLLLFPL